jgi:hypothetical protein
MLCCTYTGFCTTVYLHIKYLSFHFVLVSTEKKLLRTGCGNAPHCHAAPFDWVSHTTGGKGCKQKKVLMRMNMAGGSVRSSFPVQTPDACL